jgi:hypothetical protein
MWNGVPDIVKRAIKKPLNALGLDLVRFEPVESPPREFIWISSLGINTVIDIGANIGQFAMKIHGVVPNASIFSFERRSL